MIQLIDSSHCSDDYEMKMYIELLSLNFAIAPRTRRLRDVTTSKIILSLEKETHKPDYLCISLQAPFLYS